MFSNTEILLFVLIHSFELYNFSVISLRSFYPSSLARSDPLAISLSLLAIISFLLFSSLFLASAGADLAVHLLCHWHRHLQWRLCAWRSMVLGSSSRVFRINLSCFSFFLLKFLCESGRGIYLYNWKQFDRCGN